MKKLFLLFASFSLIINAQINFQPLYNVSNTPSATSDYHSVYSLGAEMYFNPNFYLVWGDNGEIKFKMSTDDGQNWSANKTVSTTPNTCGYPVVAANYYSIVILYHTIAAGGSYEIICQKSDNGGLNWSAMQKISGTASAITPQVLYDPGQNILYAVWEERPDNNYEIYFSKSTDFGTTWSAPQNISNTATTSRWVQLQVSNGVLFCAWVETSTYPLSDINFIKSTDHGATWTSPVNITNDARPQNRIYMAVDKYFNTLYIASDDIITFNFDEIFLMKSFNGGNTWTTPVNITNNEGHSNTPCLEVFSDVVYFTWSDNTHSAPAYDNSDIFFKWSSDGGSTWSDSLNLSTNAETSSRPRICWSIPTPIDAWHIFSSVIWYDYSTGDSEILARNAYHIAVPVELTNFTADTYGNSVKLEWSTSSETNNKGFDIERKLSSSDTWQSLTFIPGKGTSTEKQDYAFTDNNILPGKYNYRLKQIDFDGTFEYSNEVETEVGLPHEFVLEQNYPNPFNPLTTIKYRLPSNEYVTLNVYNSLGEIVNTLINTMQPAGSYEAKFDASELASGIYIYKMQAGDFISVKKMILNK